MKIPEPEPVKIPEPEPVLRKPVSAQRSTKPPLNKMNTTQVKISATNEPLQEKHKSIRQSMASNQTDTSKLTVPAQIK